ncbi:MAG TPA: class I lanthipeptide [Mycobacteriales bacterium]|jgi:hypothetical protein|nr:class I lanthipeptide [Mycobacteriales bacterium]
MRTLTLKKETLAELTAAELGAIAGAAAITKICTDTCGSDFAQCFTVLTLCY